MILENTGDEGFGHSIQSRKGREKVLGSYNFRGKIGISRVQKVTGDKVFGSGSSIDKFLVFESFPAIFHLLSSSSSSLHLSQL